MNDLFIGRAAERAAIDAMLASARQGVADAMLLWGPPGIGKSALVEYAVARAAEFRVIRVVGIESEMGFGYAAVHQVALLLVDRVDALPGPQRAALDGVLGNGPQGAVDPFLVGLALLTLVSEAARAEPVLAVIDDAQWLDDESAVAFSFVGQRLRAERVASLVTMRDVPVGGGGFDTIRRVELGGLSPEESRALLAAAAGRPIDEIVARRIVGAADGNPLALVELPALLNDEQLRGTAPLPDPLPIDTRLAGLFAGRVRALDDNARAVLLLASAERLGDPLLLRRAAGSLDEVAWEDAVESAEASGLAVFAPRVQFRHPLVRSTVLRRRAGRPAAGARGAGPRARRRTRRRPSGVAPGRRR